MENANFMHDIQPFDFASVGLCPNDVLYLFLEFGVRLPLAMLCNSLITAAVEVTTASITPLGKSITIKVVPNCLYIIIMLAQLAGSVDRKCGPTLGPPQTWSCPGRVCAAFLLLTSMFALHALSSEHSWPLKLGKALVKPGAEWKLAFI